MDRRAPSSSHSRNPKSRGYLRSLSRAGELLAHAQCDSFPLCLRETCISVVDLLEKALLLFWALKTPVSMADESFLKHAVLDTIVPHASEVNLEEALSSGLRVDSDDSLSLLSSIQQRDLLFFGMLSLSSIAIRALQDCMLTRFLLDR